MEDRRREKVKRKKEKKEKNTKEIKKQKKKRQLKKEVKVGLFIFCLAVLLFVGFFFWGTQLRPSSSSITGAVIGLEGDASPTSCGYVNADVTLSQDISTAATCLVINTSHIVINGNGFTISGAQATNVFGVNITSFHNITIKNLNVKNFSTSYFISGSQNSTIFNSSGHNASNDNVFLRNAYGLNFSNNTLINSTNQLMELVAVNESIFHNNTLIISNDLAMSFITALSLNDNITDNTIYSLGTSGTTSAIQLGSSSNSNGINIFNNTFRLHRALAGIREGYNSSVINNTFLIGLDGEVNGNTYGIDASASGEMLYLGNTIRGYVRSSNGIYISSTSTINVTFQENYLNLTGALSKGISASTNAGKDNKFIANFIATNNSGAGGGGPNFEYTSSSDASVIIIDNTFINPLQTYQLELGGPSTSGEYILINNTYNWSNITFTSNSVYVDFRWWVIVNITAANGTPIASATVDAYNLTDNLEVTQSTDAQGLVRLNLTEKKQKLTFDFYRSTPHDINVSAAGYLPNSTTVNISTTQSTQVNLVLAVNDSTNPSVTINTPLNNSNLSSNFVVNATVTDNIGLDTVQFRYENSSTNGAYVSMSQSGDYWNGTFAVSTVSDGNYTIRVNATDTNGNRNDTVTRFVSIDRVAPDTPGFNTPTDRQSFVAGDTIIFNASISNSGGTSIHTVRFQLENGTNGLVNLTPSSTNATLYNFSIALSSGSGVAEGNRTIKIFANDTAGNMNNSVNITFFVDLNNPNVTINSPASNRYYNSNFVINATVADAQTITSVQYRFENSSTNGAYTALSQRGDYWNVTFDASSVSNGNYTFRINATDASNNQNTSVTVTNVAIDTINPTLTATTANNSNLSSNRLTFVGTASDANPDRVVINDSRLSSNVGSYAEWNFTNNTMDEGVFYFLITANDSAGNSNQTTLAMTIDRTAPDVQAVNTPQDRRNFTDGNQIVFNASIAAGSGTALHTVIFQAGNGTDSLGNGQAFNLTANSSNSTLFYYDVNISSLRMNDGNHTLRIFANDTAGNLNNSLTTTFIVDSKAPDSVELRNLSNGATTTDSTPQFTWAVNDSLSGVMSCELYLNRTLNATEISAVNSSATNYTLTKALADGTYNWSVTCNDSVRLSNTSSAFNFTVDTTSPSLTINLPANNSNFSTQKVSVEGAAADNNGDKVVINDSRFGSNLGTFASWNFSNASLSAGTYNLLITANDTSGSNQSQLVAFTVDLTSPDAQGFNTPAERQNFTTGNTIVFNASISNGSGAGGGAGGGTSIHTVRFQLENGTNGLVNLTVSSTNATLYNFSITIGSGVAEGNRTITIFANDTAGNLNNSVSRTFFVDQTSPNATVTCTPSSVTVGGTVTCSCAGEDDEGSGVVNVSFTDTLPSTATAGTFTTAACNVTDNVRQLTNATGNYTVTAAAETTTTTTGGGSGGNGGGGAAAAAEGEAGEAGETGETAPAEPSEPSIAAEVATPEEVRKMLENKQLVINIASTVTAAEAARAAPSSLSSLDSALTGRAIGAPPARYVERRSLIDTKTVSVTFTNRADKAVSIAPAIRERSSVQLPDEQRAQQIIEERIKAALAKIETTEKSAEKESKQIAREEEIAQKTAETIETIKKIEEEDVQFISTTRALAPQKGIFFLPTIDSSVSYSGGHTTGRLLKTEVLNPDEVIIKPGETITTNYNVRLPITTKPKPVTLTLTTAGEDIQKQTIEASEKVRVGTALSLDPEQGIIDVYILTPKISETNTKETKAQGAKKYILEFNINKGKSVFFPNSKFSELFGPYEIKKDQIFAQELSYDKKAYRGKLPVSLKIYEEGILVAENDYIVDFGTGTVKEGLEPTLFTGLGVTGRAIFAGLNTPAKSSSSYLLGGLLFLIAAFFLAVGIAALRRIALSGLPHRPVAGALPRKMALHIPLGIRSAFLERELSKINRRLTTLEEEEIGILLQQKKSLERLQIKPEERAITPPRPTVIPFPEKNIIFDEELQNVEKMINQVESLPAEKVKVKSNIPAYSPLGAQEALSERRKIIDQELQRVTGALTRGEKRPSSLLAQLFWKKFSWEKFGEHRRETKAARKLVREAAREVARISRRIEGKTPRPSSELIEIEQQLAALESQKSGRGKSGITDERKIKIKTIIPSMTEIARQVAYENAKLRQERALIERVIRKQTEVGSGDEEKRGSRNQSGGVFTTKEKTKRTAELDEIEQAIFSVENTPLAHGKVKANLPAESLFPLPERLSERKNIIDSELQRVTGALKRAEKKPSSLLARLFTGELGRRRRETKAAKKLAQEAVREVMRISRRIEGKTPRPSNELIEIEQQLAVLGKADTVRGEESKRESGRERKISIRTTIPSAAELSGVIKEERELLEEKAAIENLLGKIASRVSPAEQKRERRMKEELNLLEHSLAKVEEIMDKNKKGKVVTSVPRLNFLEREQAAETSFEEMLRRQRTSIARPLRKAKPSRELEEINKKLSRVEQGMIKKVQIRESVPSRTFIQSLSKIKDNFIERRIIETEMEEIAGRFQPENKEKEQKKKLKKSKELMEIEQKLEKLKELNNK